MALTSERPYRPALRSEEALAIIRADVPQRLDREAFTALEPVLAEQGGTPRRPGERLDADRTEAALNPEKR